MNLGLVAEAPTIVKLHLGTVLPAFALGTWLMVFSTKGARPHRALGALYLGLMTATAIAAFFIRRNGQFSLLHLLIPLTLFGVVSGLWHARRGNTARHRTAMIALYVGALLLAGGFALTPGRLMHSVLFE